VEVQGNTSYSDLGRLLCLCFFKRNVQGEVNVWERSVKSEVLDAQQVLNSTLTQIWEGDVRHR